MLRILIDRRMDSATTLRSAQNDDVSCRLEQEMELRLLSKVFSLKTD
jgi:hypothetical protein